MIRNKNTSCPETGELAAFAIGDLVDARLEHLAKHIDQCDLCGFVVDEISKQSDSGLVAELRAIGVQTIDLKSGNEEIRGMSSGETVASGLRGCRSIVDPGFL